jgi:hypothetical protein
MPDGNRDYGLKATLKEPLPQLALVLAGAVFLLWLLAGT